MSYIKKYIAFIFIGFFLLHCSLAFSGVIGAGTAGPNNSCVEGTKGVLENDKDNACSWIEGTFDNYRAVVVWGAGQVFTYSPNAFEYEMGFSRGYVPFSGEFGLRMYFCPSVVEARCTISSSVQYFDSVYTRYLKSTQKVTSQRPIFGGYNGILAQASNACYAYIDSSGKAWKSDGDFFCGDAITLPSEPADCYLNYGNDFDVNMGELERSEISTNIDSSSHTVKKELDILCTRDATLSADITFSYSTISIGSNEIIHTTANGVGIALFYNNQLVSPASVFNDSFIMGYSHVDLEFRAVRDASQSISDIPAGEFTASAVMIMTVQ
ncbi:TPA: hypothetical protein MYQ36_004492 [Citrobacter braakii]|nr:hypothetical protein [Citrobacter braakii]